MLEQSAKKHHVTITDFTALSPSDESMRYHLTVTADLDGDIHTFLHNILHQHGGYVGLERYAVTRSENQAHATIDFAIYGGT